MMNVLKTASLIIFIALLSCSQDQVESDMTIDQTTSVKSNLIDNETYTVSFTEHNKYLENIYNNLNNDFDQIDNQTNTDLAFTELDYGFPEINYDTRINFYNTTKKMFYAEGTMVEKITVESKILGQFYEGLMGIISKACQNNYSPVGEEINDYLTGFITNADLTEIEEEIALATAGIAHGSYEYWSNGDNMYKWHKLNSDNEPLGFEKGWRWPTWQEVADFTQADSSGGCMGGLVGSLAPGIGTVAGAVMGGSIASGIEALSW